jgi:hypothetical protein
MEASGGQLHAPASLLPEKELLVLAAWEAGWVAEAIWTPWSREQIHALATNRSLAVHQLVRRYTDSQGQQLLKFRKAACQTRHVCLSFSRGAYRV